MRFSVLAVLWASWLCGLLACESPTAAPPGELAPPASAPQGAAPASVAVSAADTAEARAFARAAEAAQRLGGELKQRLEVAMQGGGPEAAIAVCADYAQHITAAAQAEGVQVGRSSLRLRNPKNRAPDWVQAWLVAQGERAVAGLEPLREVEDGKARLLKPIGVEPLCVTCHGPADSLPPGVSALLKQRYPDDKAVGYTAGDLRGALWAEVAL